MHEFTSICCPAANGAGRLQHGLELAQGTAVEARADKATLSRTEQSFVRVFLTVFFDSAVLAQAEVQERSNNVEVGNQGERLLGAAPEKMLLLVQLLAVSSLRPARGYFQLSHQARSNGREQQS